MKKDKRTQPLSKKQQLKSQETFCTICDRVCFGVVVPLPGRKWRHDSCGLGSDAWQEYFLVLPLSKRKPLQEFFDHTYKEEV